MDWTPTSVAVEARHAHLLAQAERRRVVQLARRAEGHEPPASGARAPGPARLVRRLVSPRRRMALPLTRYALFPLSSSIQ